MSLPNVYFERIPQYKYRTTQDTALALPELLGLGLETLARYDNEFLALNGSTMQLLVRAGYAWDGASGPTLDTDDTMLASLVHDALYQLIRLGVLPTSARKPADKILYRIGRAKGMHWIRVGAWYVALRLFGYPAARGQARV